MTISMMFVNYNEFAVIIWGHVDSDAKSKYSHKKSDYKVKLVVSRKHSLVYAGVSVSLNTSSLNNLLEISCKMN